MNEYERLLWFFFYFKMLEESGKGSAMEAHLNPRFNMWCRLIPSYLSMGETSRNNAKMKIVKGLGFNNLCDVQPIETDCAPMMEFVNCVPMKIKKENDMYAQAVVVKHDHEVIPTDQQQTNYLLDRLSQVFWKKMTDLREPYFMDDEPYPKTPQEFVDRIKTGKFIIRKAEKLDEDEEPVYWDAPHRYIRFRDPERKPDIENYNKAVKVLDKMKDDTKDLIVIKTPEEGLKALQEFEIAEVTIQ